MVLGLNRRAQLRPGSRLAVVPGAVHLFEEPGTAAAAALARDWFISHFPHSPGPAAPPAARKPGLYCPDLRP
jgi:putative phosphoribosyl transferase